MPSAIDSDSIEPLAALHSKLKFEWYVAYFFNLFKLFQKKNIKVILCNFSMRTLKCFLRNLNFFSLKKLKKPPSKVAQNNSNPLFSLLPELPKRPKKNSCSKMWPTVYRTGYISDINCTKRTFCC